MIFNTFLLYTTVFPIIIIFLVNILVLLQLKDIKITFQFFFFGCGACGILVSRSGNELE